MRAKDETEEKSVPVEAGAAENGAEREEEGGTDPNLEKDEGPTRTGAATEYPKPRKGRRKAKEAATAWKARNAEYLRRRSETIEFPGQALAIWEGVRAELGDERRYGKPRGGVGKPKGLVRRAPMVGDSIERQVYAKVEHDRLFLKPGDTLEAAIERWPLPFTFYDPVPPLCPADVDALRRQGLDEERERRREEQAKEGHDGRLLPGMERR